MAGKRATTAVVAKKATTTTTTTTKKSPAAAKAPAARGGRSKAVSAVSEVSEVVKPSTRSEKKKKDFRLEFTEKNLKNVLRKCDVKRDVKNKVMRAYKNYRTYEHRKSEISRPLNAWMYFCQDKRPEVRAARQEELRQEGNYDVDAEGNPKVPTQEITKLLKKEWDRISLPENSEEMSVYQEKARGDRERYDSQMAELNDYLSKLESGEIQLTDESSAAAETTEAVTEATEAVEESTEEVAEASAKGKSNKRAAKTVKAAESAPAAPAKAARSTGAAKKTVAKRAAK